MVIVSVAILVSLCVPLYLILPFVVRPRLPATMTTRKSRAPIKTVVPPEKLGTVSELAEEEETIVSAYRELNSRHCTTMMLSRCAQSRRKKREIDFWLTGSFEDVADLVDEDDKHFILYGRELKFAEVKRCTCANCKKIA